MKELLKNKKEIIIVASIVVVLILVVWIASGKSPIISYKPVGYVTIDIDKGVSLGYNKKNKVVKVTNYNAKNNEIKLEDVKNLDIIEAMDKILNTYTNGTIILIGIDKSDVGKKVEDYLINDYAYVDRSVIKITYIDSKQTELNDISLGKNKLFNDIKVNKEELKNKSMEEVLEYAREKELSADDYLYDLEELDNFVPRFQ